MRRNEEKLKVLITSFYYHDDDMYRAIAFWRDDDVVRAVSFFTLDPPELAVEDHIDKECDFVQGEEVYPKDIYDEIETLYKKEHFTLKEYSGLLLKEDLTDKEKARLKLLETTLIRKAKEIKKKREMEEKKRKELMRTLYNLIPLDKYVFSTIENQYGERIEERSVTVSPEGYQETWINCYSSSSLGLGTCQCVSHDPWESYESDNPFSLLKTLAMDMNEKAWEETLRSNEVDANEVLEALKKSLKEVDKVDDKEFRKAFKENIGEIIKSLEAYVKNTLKAKRVQELLLEAGVPEQFVADTIVNQYGETLTNEEYYMDEGKYYCTYINCHSSMSLGLGTCRCVSHDPIKTDEVSLLSYLKHLKKAVEEGLVNLKNVSESRREKALQELKELVRDEEIKVLQEVFNPPPLQKDNKNYLSI